MFQIEFDRKDVTSTVILNEIKTTLENFKLLTSNGIYLITSDLNLIVNN